MIKKQIEIEPMEAKLLLPIINIAYALIEKSFKNREEAVDRKITRWFKESNGNLKLSVKLEYNCILEATEAQYHELFLIKDMLLDTLPYYTGDTKKIYLSLAVKFDKCMQYFCNTTREGC